MGILDPVNAAISVSVGVGAPVATPAPEALPLPGVVGDIVNGVTSAVPAIVSDVVGILDPVNAAISVSVGVGAPVATPAPGALPLPGVVDDIVNGVTSALPAVVSGVTSAVPAVVSDILDILDPAGAPVATPAPGALPLPGVVDDIVNGSGQSRIAYAAQRAVAAGVVCHR